MLILLGLVLTSVLVHAQDDQAGFISIDCGIVEGSTYTDNITNINYVSDADFIDSGEIHNILPIYFNPFDVDTQLLTLRSFPQNTRNCYTLKPTQGKGYRYLIRAKFMYGNYDFKGQLPEFDVYLGPDYWDTVKFNSSSKPTYREVIHVLSSDYLHVCLVNTGGGTPFISAIELRYLAGSVYKETDFGSLNLFTRVNFGYVAATIRYPADKYDRLWRPYRYSTDKYDQPWDPDRRPDVTNINILDEVETGFFIDIVPPEVMSDAIVPNYPNASLNFSWVSDNATDKFFVYIHFAEIENLKRNQRREFNIYVNGNLFYAQPFSPLNLTTTTIYNQEPEIGAPEYTLTMVKTKNSNLPPLINALEIFTLKQFPQNQTYDQDVAALWSIKSTYKINKNWQGDPCTPQEFSWDGIGCSYNDSVSPRIVSLNLSFSGLKGGIDTGLANLTMLRILDLSNNNLTGTVPNFFTGLNYLTVLNLKGNNFFGPIPSGLQEKADKGSLSLRVVLGNGGFGTVYHGIIGDTQVAVKMLSGSSLQGDKEFQAEAYLLLGIHHKNLISLVGYCNDETHKGIVYEYMAHGNLESHIYDTTSRFLNWEERLQIVCDAAHGLQYLHHGCKPPIVHRDIKGTNILLNEAFHAKLADFGLSKAFPAEGGTHISTAVAGTPGYLDPEYYTSNRLTKKSDVYSFGVVLLVVITGQPAITKHENENVHISRLVNLKLAEADINNIVDPRLQGEFQTNSAWKAVELAMACVAHTPSRRPTMNEVMIELNDCLVAEKARQETKPKKTGLMSLNLESAYDPTPL